MPFGALYKSSKTKYLNILYKLSTAIAITRMGDILPIVIFLFLILTCAMPKNPDLLPSKQRDLLPLGRFAHRANCHDRQI
jgi:hypothetical protein